MITNKTKYINIGFFTLLFVITTAFLKEHFFYSSTLITNGLSGLIGMGISSVVSLAVRHFKIISKLVILIGFLGVVIIYSKTEKISSTLIQGLWITQENELVLKVEITDKEIKMLFLPDNKTLQFDYEMNGNMIEIYNDNESEYFVWEIKKLKRNYLTVVEDKEMIFNFRRE